MRHILHGVLYGWLVLLSAQGVFATTPPSPYDYDERLMSAAVDTFPFKRDYDDFLNDTDYNPFDIQPDVIKDEVEYDPESGNYILYQKIGDEYYSAPTYMTFSEYVDWKAQQQQKEYFSTLSGQSSASGVTFAGKIDPVSKIDVSENLVDRLFGGTDVTIQPRGNIDLTFGVRYQRNENPFIPATARNNAPFIDFDQQIEMSVDGKIGEKIDLNFNYNTAATFDFDNKFKIDYNTLDFSEDDIIKSIELGDVSMPLRSQLIVGPSSLFGAKTEWQFGRLRVTGVAAQQRAQQNNLRIENGSVVRQFEIRPDQYDENRHFFLSHYNRDSYEDNLELLPINASEFRVTNIEVWVTTDQNSDLRNATAVTAVSLLGETDPSEFSFPDFQYQPIAGRIMRDRKGRALPANNVSDFFGDLIGQNDDKNIKAISRTLENQFGLQQTRDFEVQSMRRLNPNEYSINDELGILSLNVRLRPNQVLGVAYEYSYTQFPNEVFKVGEMTNEASKGGLDSDSIPEPQDVILVKMLKSSNQRTDLPSWDLMMKNVYPLGGSQISSEDFQLDIFYEDREAANYKKFLPEDGFRTLPLINLFGLDNLNSQNDPQPDGIFDYVPGYTINTQTGSVFFPVLEPFGDALREVLQDDALYAEYGYPTLYDQAVILARENPDNNRFLIAGQVKSGTSSEFSLGAFNVPRGSVTVRAGSQLLQEGIDYDIDYGIGRIKIINEAFLQQGVPIDISFEDQSLFSLQQKTMFGLRADYALNKHVQLGATYMRLFERPFTEKVNIGDDPINNRVFGLDFNYNQESPLITKLVDKLPFYSTKETSSISFTSELAAIKPGHARAINLQDEDDDNISGGVVNIDDFEGSGSFISLGTQPNLWSLASVPNYGINDVQGRFREALRDSSVVSGYNRANLSWYVIDDRRARSPEDNVDPYTRVFDQTELFNRQIALSQIPDLLTFDLSYYPDERGPYNYDPPAGQQGISAGLEVGDDGCVRLRDPESRWGGIMRYLPNNDFQASNFEYIDFWMLNPFMDRRDGEAQPAEEEGEILFNLGNISEDILKDNCQFFENNIAVGDEQIPVARSAWGQVPLSIPQVIGFDRANSEAQDVGLDGLDDVSERIRFQEYIDQVAAIASSDTCVLNDPAADNFIGYNDANAFGNETNLLERYKQFNNPQGNALTENSNVAFGFGRGNPIPDKEDLNDNRSLEKNESFYEYKLRIKNDNGEIERFDGDFITDQTTVINPTTGAEEKWYRYQIPIQSEAAYEKIGSIEGFRSIQFVRMYMTGFETSKTFRLAEFELVRNQWRRLPVETCDGELGLGPVQFIIDQVGIEENSNKLPFNYVSPKGIQQQRLPNTFNSVLQDEKAMRLSVCNLPRVANSNSADEEGCIAGSRIYKLTDLDFRLFETLELFVHGEKRREDIEDGQMSIYLRLGKDFNNNYYEYELPLVFSDPEVARSLENRPGDYTEEVWRAENKLDFNLEQLLDLKRLRNQVDFPITERFSTDDNPAFELEQADANITIKGVPSLGQIKAIQLGIRNNSAANGCAEVWFNELRLSGLEERGGVAGLARLEIQMADLGDITGAAQYSSVGFGNIEQQLFERSQEELIDYDIATNLNLGKFLPTKWNVRVPFYAQYAKSFVNHRWDQFELDLKADEVLETATTAAEAREIRERNREETTISTINLTNVRKERGPEQKGAPKPWSIENFSVSYAKTEKSYKDVLIREEKSTDERASLDYNYTRRAKYIQPFKGIKSKYLKLISEFNFNPLPNSFAFSTDLNRFTSTRQFRLPQEIDYVFDDKRFNWDRDYNLQWDLTKSLKTNFTASNRSIIDELRQTGIAVDAADREWSDEFGNENTVVNGQLVSYKSLADADDGYVRRYWQDNFRQGGRNKSYNQSLSIDYTLPLRYLPFMDWTTIRASYNSDYTWDAGSLILPSIGNIIANNQSRSINATLSFDKLYKKSKFLKELDSNQRRRSSRRPRKKARGDDNETPTANEERSRRRSGGTQINKTAKFFLRPLLTLRNIKLTYREISSTVIPGFTGVPSYLGTTGQFDAPGLGFAFGLQPNIDYTDSDNWLRTIQRQGFITPDTLLNQLVQQNNTQNYEAKIALEPWRDFKVDVNFNKSYRLDHQENFKNNATANNPVDFQQANFLDVGSFEVSYWGIPTLFGQTSAELFNAFEFNRSVVSNRLFREAQLSGEPLAETGDHPEDGQGFKAGFGKLHNEVMTTAFLATYTGGDILTFPLDIEQQISQRAYIPRPNWELRYNGLSKVEPFKNIFSSFSVTHSYNGSLQVNQFRTDREYTGLILSGASQYSLIDTTKSQLNYFTRLEIPTIVIDERFAPLIGVDVKTKNGINLNFEYQKSRNLSLQTGAVAQLTESKASEIIFGFGWILENVNIGFLTGQRKGRNRRGRNNRETTTPGTDSRVPTGRGGGNIRERQMTINITMSLRDDATEIYELDSGRDGQATRGAKTFSFSPSIDYVVNRNLTLRTFVDYSYTNPKNSNAFPLTNFNSGITVRFTLN